jgi:predicted anti-sigma-YlaC factor YlaD
MNDSIDLECEAAREAMSANMDGETSPISASWLTEHLVGCPGCRAWHQGALDIRRRTRLTLVPTVPDLTAQIHQVVAESTTGVAGSVSSWRRTISVWRALLSAIAVVQLWFALPVLLFARDHDVTTHPAHELGSFDTALAVGFLAVAWRPPLARGMRPLVGVIAALLLLTAGIDLVHHRTTLSDEAPHLLSFAAYVLMCLLVRSGSGGTASEAAAPTASNVHPPFAPPQAGAASGAEPIPRTGNEGRATA